MKTLIFVLILLLLSACLFDTNTSSKRDRSTSCQTQYYNQGYDSQEKVVKFEVFGDIYPGNSVALNIIFNSVSYDSNNLSVFL